MNSLVRSFHAFGIPLLNGFPPSVLDEQIDKYQAQSKALLDTPELQKCRVRLILRLWRNVVVMT
jgi:hypothetical protein